MANPFEGWTKLNEGWDGGAIAVDEMIENLKTVVGNSLRTVLLAVVFLWGMKLLVTLLGTVCFALGFWVTDVFNTVATAVYWLGVVVTLVIAIVQQSLYRSIQLQAFEGREFVSGAGEALKLAREVVGKVAIAMLLLGAATFLGLFGCVVGSVVAFFFFCQAPYLAATTELTPWQCMRRSYELNKAYAVPAVLAVGISLLGPGLLTGCGGAVVTAIGTAAMGIAPPVGSAIIGLGNDLFGLLSSGLILIVTGAVFTTVQSVERGVPFRR